MVINQSRRWGHELQTCSLFTVSLAIIYRRFGAAKELLPIASKMKKKNPLEKLDFIIVSQTEEVMYYRQENNYGGELVTQIFMILGYLNFSFKYFIWL